jgi:acyl-CoA thioester hydrolase
LPGEGVRAAKMEVRVYYEDTDCGGVVYYANYLRYIERARTEYLRERGVDLVTLMEGGIIFVVRSVQVGYKSSARYNDLLSIDTELTLGRASLHFTHAIKRGETTIVNAVCELACVGRSGKPIRIPEDVKKSLSR